jgi:hypothetical protein
LDRCGSRHHRGLARQRDCRGDRSAWSFVHGCCCGVRSFRGAIEHGDTVMLRREEIAQASYETTSSEAARKFGISKKTVWNARWRVNNIEKWRKVQAAYRRQRYAKDEAFRASQLAAIKAWQKANPEKVLAYSRASYHRTKKLGGVNGFWSEEQTNTLIKMHQHHSYSEIAAALGVSRSCVAGRTRRLKLEGRL